MSYPNDTQYEDKKIVDVDYVQNTITTEDGWTFYLGDNRPIPVVIGQTARFYGEGFGRVVRGLYVDGVKFFYKTVAEQAEEHERWKIETRTRMKQEYDELMAKIKDEPAFETVDMTGFGGGYERACQLMLQAGIKYLENKPNFIWDYKEFKSVYGIAYSDSEHAKRLDAVLMEACNNDCSGAMHQCVIGHLRYIHQNGREKWLANFKEERHFMYPSQLPEPTF